MVLIPLNLMYDAGMTEREKVAHLYRRLGFGATTEEIARGEREGAKATASRLIDFDGVDDGFPISPWSFCFDEGKDEIYLDSFRPAVYWSLRMVMSQRPLQEKLALFWHDHFAVSGSKVEAGPMMLHYLEILRNLGSGNFRDLLLEISQSPAMCFWLDTHENLKDAPNENFAREVMELFTVQIGNYTERDVQEAARAFTGWGVRYLVFEKGGENVQEVARDCILRGRPMFTFAYSPELHDTGIKTVLGKRGNLTGEDVIDFLAGHPKTQTAICKKLWEFFVYENPAESIISELVNVFQSSNGNIRKILWAIVQHPEFWSERAIRTKIKSPVDFSVSILRQLRLNSFLIEAHGKTPKPFVAAPKALRDIGGAAFGLSTQQGLSPLFPPNVAGWDWGTAWITPNNMMYRNQVGQLIVGTADDNYVGSGVIALRLTELGADKSPQGVVDGLLTLFDAKLPDEKRAVLIEGCRKHGGHMALTEPQPRANMLGIVLRGLFASPEFQFC